MNSRGEIFSIIADIRGRLDELESFVRALPGTPVPTPASFDEPGVEALTPAAYLDFRRTGLADSVDTKAFDRSLGFFQVGCHDDALPVSLESFELSGLHKSGPEPAFGLRAQPGGPQQAWLTYEFIAPAASILECDWTEWILKVSTPEPCELVVQFVVAGKGLNEKIPHSRQHVTEFASFLHIRLPGATLRGALAGRAADEVRLLLGTGGKPVPLRVYGFSIFGKH